MKTHKKLALLAVLILGVSIPLSAGESPALHEKLKDMAPFIGDWTVHGTDPSGKPINSRWSAKPELGGTIVTGRTEVKDPQGRPFLFRVEIFFWQEESKSIGSTLFDAFGSRSATAKMTRVNDRKSIIQKHGYSMDGKYRTKTVTLERIDDDTFTVQSTSITLDGEPKPDEPKITLKRIKG